MTSYHRILRVFGRAVTDHSIQCDCDLHPWQVTINGERWTGKIRLIGFIDVLFLISYSQTSTFQRGIVIYKDEDDIERILTNARLDLSTFQQAADTTVVGEDTPAGLEDSQPDSKKVKSYYKNWRDSMDYKIKSVGHEVGLQVRYPRESVKQYEIIVRKPDQTVQKNQIKRAFRQHDTLDMIEDAIAIGYIAYADVLGTGLGQLVGAGPAAAILKNFTSGVTAGQSGQPGGLSGGNL